MVALIIDVFFEWKLLKLGNCIHICWCHWIVFHQPPVNIRHLVQQPKQLQLPKCLKNFKKYKKCLLAIICPAIVYKIQKYSCPAIVCPASIYELHKTLTLHNPNALYIATKIFIYCPCRCPCLSHHNWPFHLLFYISEP